jgi:hypothetical protein
MRVATTTLAFYFLLASAQLVAADLSSATSSHVSRRQQLADCMTKRMYSNRALSYNDAAKACKDELQGSKTDAALSKAPKPVG